MRPFIVSANPLLALNITVITRFPNLKALTIYLKKDRGAISTALFFYVRGFHSWKTDSINNVCELLKSVSYLQINTVSCKFTAAPATYLGYVC